MEESHLLLRLIQLLIAESEVFICILLGVKDSNHCVRQEETKVMLCFVSVSFHLVQ